MRNNLLILFLLMITQAVSAQKLTVESMQATNDLSASQHRRQDLNGDPCGLVKVRLATAGATFEGNIIQPIEYKTGEYWVYMTKGSKELHVKHPSFLPIEVHFGDYGFGKGIQSLTTYTLTLVMPQIAGMDVDDGNRFLAMTVEPKDAMVYIDNQLQRLQDGVLSILLPMGQHQYRVEAPACESKSGSFIIGNETSRLTVRLESTMASLNINSTIQGTQIYVNEQLKGTTSWSGSLPAGTYRIEGRLQGHRNYRQSITLAQHDNKQITIPQLMAITGALSVNYQPIDAEVWIDGKKAGTSPNVFRNIIAGNHQLEIQMSGYETKRQSITIEEGKSLSLSGTLTRTASSTNSGGNTFLKSNNQEEEAALKMSGSKLWDIGSEYYWGYNGKTKDYSKAVFYYRLSAEKGNSNGQNSYGHMFYHGYGVKQDFYESFKWVCKSAEQGNVIGEYNLGEMYENGKGIDKNISQAKYWYEKAAAKGSEEAKKALERLNSSNNAPSGEITIRGTVVDKKGEAIIGASVLIDGTRSGTVTDFYGNFSLKVSASGNTRLKIAYVRKRTQIIDVDKVNNPKLRIVLK